MSEKVWEVVMLSSFGQQTVKLTKDDLGKILEKTDPDRIIALRYVGGITRVGWK